AEVSALVRPTVAPVTVSADACPDALVIPETGGFFTGNTSTATANFSAGCDVSGLAFGGANDHLLRLNLTERRRVVFDMTGSTFVTLLDIRSGEICPGVEVPNGCNVGSNPNRSFLDLTLDPGTYWVQVDGYNMLSGAYNLDVRVLPPS